MTTANSPVLVQKERLDELKAELVRTLREMFQIDSPGLNFGVYRIMNQRRGEIERFLQEDLVACVDAEFGRYDEELAVSIEKDRVALERVIAEEIADDALTERGIAERYLVTKRAKELQGQWEDLQRREGEMTMSDVQKAEVFGHLTEFFSRYYEDGDFLSLRRYSREGKYAIPYNGEEVLLHWANKDQYYVKSDAFLRGHGFDAGEVHVVFEVVDSEETSDTGKLKTKLVVVPCGEENEVEYFAEENTLIIRFARRFLTPEERKKLFPPMGDAEEITAHLLKSSHIPAGLRKKLAGKKDDPGKPELLKQHVEAFTKESTSDFFIHKNLGKFLRGELDFYIKNEVFRLDDLGTDEEVKVELFVRRAKILKTVGERIISFLAQLEDFQKMLWEKKKFVFRSEYCITVDHIPEEFYAEICANEQQMAEWRRLYALDDAGPKTKKGQETLFAQEKVVFDADFLATHPFVMVDTAFFSPEFKDRLLEHLVNPKTGDPVDDLDEATGGLMIHSENWQALNTISAYYDSSIDYCYIDPPYNTDSAPILYKNDYRDSCWLSILDDRLLCSLPLLREKMVYTVAIDETELSNLLLLLRSVFTNHKISPITVVHNPKGSITKDFNRVHEYAIFVTKNDVTGSISRTLEENDSPRKLRRWGENSLRMERKPSFYPIYIKEEKIVGIGSIPKDDFHPSGKNEVQPDGTIAVWPIDQNGIERRWNFGLDSIFNNLNRIIVIKSDDEYDLYVTHELTVPKSVFEVKEEGAESMLWKGGEFDAGNYGNSLLLGMFGEKRFSYPKSIHTVLKCVSIASKDNQNAIILDFFSGSGTTAHAVLELNKDGGKRKYVLIEMGDYFYSVTKPRIQKVTYNSTVSTNGWIDGIPQNTDGQSHIFKYMELEQYEDTLDNIAFRDQDRTIQASLFSSNDYLLNYSLDFETRESSCRLNVQTMKTPFSYNLRTRRENGFEDITKDADGFRTLTVDLVETFNYLLGLHVEKRAARQNNGNTYRIIHGKTRNEERVTIIWRNCPETPEGHTKDLEEDAAFISQTLIPAFPCDTLYVNGHCFVSTAKPIEPLFKKLMGA